MAAPLITDIEAFSVRLSWLTPSQSNGIIISYHIYQNDLLSHNVRTCLLFSARIIEIDLNARSRSLYVVVRLSVCLSVTFVHRTQAIEIFGNVSTPFGTVAIC